MIEKIFEDVYTHYTGIQKLEALHEYLSKIPGSSTKKYVKCIVGTAKGWAIYNVVDILMSKSLTEENPDPEEKKTVRFIYSGDGKSKTYTMKQFAKRCKQILDLLQEKDISDVEMQVANSSDKDRGYSFRFYYDNSKAFALLVRNSSIKGVERFLETCEDDLLECIKVPESTRAPRAKADGAGKAKADGAGREKRAKKDDPHEGYYLKNEYDEYGHHIRIWQKQS